MPETLIDEQPIMKNALSCWIAGGRARERFGLRATLTDPRSATSAGGPLLHSRKPAARQLRHSENRAQLSCERKINRRLILKIPCEDMLSSENSSWKPSLCADEPCAPVIDSKADCLRI